MYIGTSFNNFKFGLWPPLLQSTDTTKSIVNNKTLNLINIYSTYYITIENNVFLNKTKQYCILCITVAVQPCTETTLYVWYINIYFFSVCGRVLFEINRVRMFCTPKGFSSWHLEVVGLTHANFKGERMMAAAVETTSFPENLRRRTYARYLFHNSHI